MARSFWEHLHEWQQNDRIRALERRGRAAVPTVDTEALQARVALQATELAMLRAVVGALAGTLRDSLARPGSVDDTVLDARLEAAIEESLLPPEPEVVPSDPSLRLVTCKRCGNEVPASSTTMTAQGFVCDRCPPVAR